MTVHIVDLSTPKWHDYSGIDNVLAQLAAGRSRVINRHRVPPLSIADPVVFLATGRPGVVNRRRSLRGGFIALLGVLPG